MLRAPLPFALLPALAVALLPLPALAGEAAARLDLTGHWAGLAALGLFVLAYLFVIGEEFTQLRKSKPVMLAAGVIWALIGGIYHSRGLGDAVAQAVRHNLLEYAELMLFLLVAMTYINALAERAVFAALRAWLVGRGFGFRALFWVTGALAFAISPVADNLTTALLMAAVVIAVGGGNRQFVLLACINIVVAANAGGAFSPFGDITTLMVWQKNLVTANGAVDFWSFFRLFVPALVNWLVPAALMSFAVPNEKPRRDGAAVTLKRGAAGIAGLFLLTIVSAVAGHNFLGLPPVLGMLTGLSYLKIYAWHLKRRGETCRAEDADGREIGPPLPYDIFSRLARAEWDTLLFFYGVVMCVGALGFVGYLELASATLYGDWGATPANIAVGLLSAVVDNIPVVFAVLTMQPEMSVGQWLLVTLTAGVGGSLLSIGSAAGVALMGQAHGAYTFFGHLKWAPAIAAGYAASIATHLWLNRALF